MIIRPDSIPDFKEYKEDNPFLKDNLSEYTSKISGVNVIPMPDNLGNNCWMSGLIIMSFLLVSVAYRSSSKYFMSIFSEIFARNERSSFSVSNNAGVGRLKLSLLMLTFVIESLIIYLLYNDYSQTTLHGIGLLKFVGFFTIITFGFYLTQYLIYILLGYIFTTKSQISIWCNTLSSLTAISGLLFVLPFLIAIYYTYSLKILIITCFAIYLVARTLLIYKGIKIFFSGFYSLIYLILYLCTLEIAPLIVLYKGIFQLFSFVELKLL